MLSHHERLLIKKKYRNLERGVLVEKVRIVDKLLEGKLLILVGAQRPILHFGQQRAKGFTLFNLNTKHLNIHEEPNKLLSILVAISAWRSHDNVSLTDHTVKQGAKDTK